MALRTSHPSPVGGPGTTLYAPVSRSVMLSLRAEPADACACVRGRGRKACSDRAGPRCWGRRADTGHGDDRRRNQADHGPSTSRQSLGRARRIATVRLPDPGGPRPVRVGLHHRRADGAGPADSAARRPVAWSLRCRRRRRPGRHARVDEDAVDSCRSRSRRLRRVRRTRWASRADTHRRRQSPDAQRRQAPRALLPRRVELPHHGPGSTPRRSGAQRASPVRSYPGSASV